MMLWYYKKLIDKYDVISFDVFDTLVERDVLIPTDVYRNIGVLMVGKKNAGRFCYERMLAEENARKKSENGEVTLKEIYDCFKPEQLNNHRIEDEIQYEAEHCRVKRSVKILFDYAICNGKKVVLVSDMYLISEQIERILESCGINGHSNIYISSEYGKSKKNGALFSEVIDLIGCINCEVLHFGDSIKADWLGTRKVGIRSRIIPRKRLLASKMKAFGVRVMLKLFKRRYEEM